MSKDIYLNQKELFPLGCWHMCELGQFSLCCHSSFWVPEGSSLLFVGVSLTFFTGTSHMFTSLSKTSTFEKLFGLLQSVFLSQREGPGQGLEEHN